MKVLVVDDSAVMRRMIRRTLELTGIPLQDIREAGNGAEALEEVRRDLPDLALVDINMPVMNGEDFIRAVQPEPEMAGLEIIVVSTEGSDTRIEEIRRMGAEFVHKPFTPEQLRATIQQVTGANDAGHDVQQPAGRGGPDF
jgi:two-component system chemotaxis response regulator CheY